MKRKRKSEIERAGRGSRTCAYPIDFRLRIVRLFLEEGYSIALICEGFGIRKHSLCRWVEAYRRCGVQGLEIERNKKISKVS